MDNKIIPEGYKETKVGVVPVDWEVGRLGKEAKVERGKFTPRPRNDPKYYGGDIPFIQTNEVVHSKGIIQNHTQTLNEKGLLVSKLFPKGTILMTIAANIGFTGILQYDMACPDSLIGIKCNDSLINRYLNYYFSFNQKRIDYLAEEAAQKNINLTTVKGLQIPIPPLNEQEKIAEILSTWDEAISKQEALIKAKEELKKGLMQKLLSGEVRFKEFKDEWKFTRLADLLDYEQPTKYLVANTDYDNDYNTPVLTAGKTFILGYTNENHGIFNNNLPVIIFDDFTTANKFVNFPFKAKSSAMKILKIKNNSVNIKMVFEMIQMIKYIAYDHKRYWISEYQELEIKLPSPKEQKKIASVLSLADNEIELLKNELDELKKQKKGLMQKLLTGQVRVKV